MIETGQTAPDFTLPANGAHQVTLSQLRPQIVVLYFYPRDDTPGCTIQANDFTARAQAFAKHGAQVLGVSRDSVASHDRFCAKYDLNVTLLSDVTGAVCEAYGVWGERHKFGRAYMGIERSTFLIGGDGRLGRIWRNVSAPDHADAVLAALAG